MGCNNTKEIEKIPLDLEKYSYVGTFMNDDEIYIEEYRYNLQIAAWDMVLLRDGEIKKRFTGVPSRPKFNKERNKMIYIDNFQFEAIGNVTIYDSETEEETALTSFDYGSSQETVKDIEWYKEHTLLCIIGYSYGTVSQGGQLYQLDMATNELKLVKLEEKISEWTQQPYEIIDIYVDGDVLEITLIEWKDDNYTDYYYTVHILTADDIDELFGE
jgi:hypothetical protein